MPKYKTYFNEQWLEDERFKSWLKSDPKDRTVAYCKVCCKSFNIGVGGIESVKQHAKGVKHSQKVAPPSDNKTISFTSTSSTQKDASSKTLVPVQTTIPISVSNKQTTEAEIMWALEVLSCKYSYRSCETKSDLFCAMFPDSKIAQQFTCGKTKCSYLLCHGISPYVREVLLGELKEVPYYTTLFDESYNKISKTGQMDLHVRFWDPSKNQVETSYLTSEFLGKASAQDVFEKYEQAISSLDKNKILQISSDGPNVNLAFLKIVDSSRKDDELDPLIDIGTCGLHTLHRSFQHGENATDWKIKKLLSSNYKIFDESPSRRADYEKLTGACSPSDYPLKFCSHRWIENASVAKRAQSIWSKTVEVINFWKTLPKSKQPGRGKVGQITSYDFLTKHCNDSLIPLKLQFFEDIATTLNEFLVTFQTDNPMVPFLVEALEKIIRCLCLKFIKKDVLQKANTCSSLLKIEVTDKKNQVGIDSVDLGFAIRHDLVLLRKTGKLSDVQLRNFRSGALLFLENLCSHIMEKCPLKYLFVRCASCLSPKSMVDNCQEINEKLFDKMLMKLVNAKRISGAVADEAKLQYSNFFSVVVKANITSFREFDKSKQRLDVFLWNYIGSDESYKSLMSICQIVFVLSHGQATVERGFSENKQLLVENLHTDSLISQRIICDYMKRRDLNPSNFPMSTSLLAHVKEARQRYKAAQIAKSKSSINNEKAQKLKELNEQIQEVNCKIVTIENSVDELKKDADKFAFEAEKKLDLGILSKSNALKRAANEKEAELSELKSKKMKLVSIKDKL